MINNFFESLKKDDTITTLNGYKISCVWKKKDKLKINVNGVNIILTKLYGNYYTSIFSKKMTKQDIIYNNLLRDIEGEVILNELQSNNPFHSQTEIYKKIKSLCVKKKNVVANANFKKN